MWRKRSKASHSDSEPSYEALPLLMQLLLDRKIEPDEYVFLFQYLCFYSRVKWGSDAYRKVIGPGFAAAEMYWWQDEPKPEDFFVDEDGLRAKVAAALANVDKVTWTREPASETKRPIQFAPYALMMKLLIDGRLSVDEFATLYLYASAYDFTKWDEERSATHDAVRSAIKQAEGDRERLLPRITEQHNRTMRLE